MELKPLEGLEMKESTALEARKCRL
jgi:hypothetical protein